MLLGMLGVSSLGNLLAGKRVKQAFDGETGTSCGGWGTPRSIKKNLMPLYPSTNFLIQRYYQNEVRLNGFYLRNYLSKKKDRVFVINLD